MKGISLWKKALIVLGIVFFIFFVIPAGAAFASGKTEALRAYTETLKYILKAHVETLKAIVKVWTKFLG